MKNKWFANKLLDWYQTNQRELPWRGSRDPYVIWLSEIIFQQTRIEQGTPYFIRFLDSFPNVFSLAAAADDQVMKLWEGLGYYNRARNLLETARKIAFEKGGVFPSNYTDLLKLKGIGEYTAASVSSICFQETQAAVDGNVYRVLSRFYADPTPIDTQAGKKRFRQLAQDLIDPNKPGDFNQALMDLGSAICTPANPDCEDCPLAGRCLSKKESRQNEFPVKVNKTKIHQRTLNYCCLSDGASVYIRQRSMNGIWPGLYELVLLEGEKTKQQVHQWLEELTGVKLRVLSDPHAFSHKLSHQSLKINFFQLEQADLAGMEISGYQKVYKTELKNRAFPIPIFKYLAHSLITSP